MLKRDYRTHRGAQKVPDTYPTPFVLHEPSRERDAVELAQRFTIVRVVVTDTTVIASSGDLLSICSECEREDGTVAAFDLCDALPVFAFKDSDFPAQCAASDVDSIGTKGNGLDRRGHVFELANKAFFFVVSLGQSSPSRFHFEQADLSLGTTSSNQIFDGMSR